MRQRSPAFLEGYTPSPWLPPTLGTVSSHPPPTYIHNADSFSCFRSHPKCISYRRLLLMCPQYRPILTDCTFPPYTFASSPLAVIPQTQFPKPVWSTRECSDPVSGRGLQPRKNDQELTLPPPPWSPSLPPHRAVRQLKGLWGNGDSLSHARVGASRQQRLCHRTVPGWERSGDEWFFFNSPSPHPSQSQQLPAPSPPALRPNFGLENIALGPSRSGRGEGR